MPLRPNRGCDHASHSASLRAPSPQRRRRAQPGAGRAQVADQNEGKAATALESGRRPPALAGRRARARGWAIVEASPRPSACGPRGLGSGPTWPSSRGPWSGDQMPSYSRGAVGEGRAGVPRGGGGSEKGAYRLLRSVPFHIRSILSHDPCRGGLRPTVTKETGGPVRPVGRPVERSHRARNVLWDRQAAPISVGRRASTPKRLSWSRAMTLSLAGYSGTRVSPVQGSADGPAAFHVSFTVGVG
jgi:hypothetical protein